MQKILVDIKDSKIGFLSGGTEISSSMSDIIANKDNIFRIQFSSRPDVRLLKDISDFLIDNPHIDLRFYGNYCEDLIDWGLLNDIQRLSIDLWETKDLNGIKNLKKLKRLGISKIVKSSVSLKVIENLDNLEMLFTSISKDIETIGLLKKFNLVSLSEIKTDNLDFLSNNIHLSKLWISLGSIKNISGIAKVQNLKTLSIHQLKGFDDFVANSVLSNCNNLEDLELMNLANLSRFTFISNLKNLRTLNLEGLKKIDSYKDFGQCDSLKVISGYDSRPLDKSLVGLENLDSIILGDSYSKSEIDSFVKRFKGRNLWIRGKQILGNNKFGGRISILNE
ncbi:hypothetical protein SAMN05216357_107107 [Porphyromonadaceae bacterium KH3CP3RA]|nr:hypothetical protein SAMN05216357_107107 [Porphyromonadaceae bacterium KH3CP3RA]